MNPQKNAIILYDTRLEKDVDKCDDIQSIVNAGGKLDIVFNGSSKVYSYNRDNVRWITNPVEILLQDKFVFLNDSLLFSIKKVLKFDDWYKIFYEDGRHRSYPASEIIIKKTVEKEPFMKNILLYLLEVADYLKSEDEGGDFLVNQIEKMRPVEGCALARFLQKHKVKKNQSPQSLVFPFGCNHSQMQAVKKAFTYDLSVIQGPPGTGKTQTILNIIANAVLKGKTIAVVSGNNEATRNIDEKLRESHLSFITAFLGNKENVERFFASPIAVSERISDWKRLAPVNRQTLDFINSQLENALTHQLQIPILQKKIFELQTEKAKRDKVDSLRGEEVYKKVGNKILTSQSILKLAALLEIAAGMEKIGLITKIRYYFQYGIRLTKKLLNGLGDTLDFLQNQYYDLKTSQLVEELKQKELLIKKQGIEKLKTQSVTFGKNALLKFVADQFSDMPNMTGEINIKNYRSRFKSFTKRYPVIFSTTNALQSCTGEGFLYDYLIIDEASQVNILTACIAFACAKNVVLVGDKMQLPHVVKSEDVQSLKTIFKAYELPNEIEYSSHSILDAVTEMYGNKLPSTLLNEHYRCDPQIIGFCNKRFYDDSLIIQTSHKSDTCGVKLITTEAHHASNRTNIRQAEVIDKDILPKLEEVKKEYAKPDGFTIGIVAPYRNQVNYLKERFDENQILINTVHKFQGKEKTVVIMSTVSDRIVKYDDDLKVDFLNNPNLINVAISRAKDILYVIASTELLNQEGSLLHDLAKYNEYYCSGGERRHTTVYSVFDLMFEEYALILEPLKNSLLKFSKHQSENIIGTLISDICNSRKYGLLKFHHNYSLRNVIKTERITDVEDIRFIKNPNTHCDFIIFDALNKEIRLAIEVDGRQHNDPIQKARDERKDRLLKSAGINLLRLPTTSIDCREKIEEALK